MTKHIALDICGCAERLHELYHIDMKSDNDDLEVEKMVALIRLLTYAGENGWETFDFAKAHRLGWFSPYEIEFLFVDELEAVLTKG